MNLPRDRRLERHDACALNPCDSDVRSVWRSGFTDTNGSVGFRRFVGSVFIGSRVIRSLFVGFIPILWPTSARDHTGVRLQRRDRDRRSANHSRFRMPILAAQFEQEKRPPSTFGTGSPDPSSRWQHRNPHDLRHLPRIVPASRVLTLASAIRSSDPRRVLLLTVSTRR